MVTKVSHDDDDDDDSYGFCRRNVFEKFKNFVVIYIYTFIEMITY